MSKMQEFRNLESGEAIEKIINTDAVSARIVNDFSGYHWQMERVITSYSIHYTKLYESNKKNN